MPLRSYLYKLRHLYALCALVMASLAGGVFAHADEAQPTPQALATPTAAEAQPTEAPISESTVETAPTILPTLIPTAHIPPTETFRVIEISTRAATFAPTYAPPTPIPTSGLPQPTIGLSPTTAPPDLPTEPLISATLTPVGGYPEGVATATIEEPILPDTVISVTPTPWVIYTLSATPTVTITPTDIPYWVPGPECSLEQGKVLVKLSVPYIHQVMDIGGANGNWACGPTSIAMVLAYYGKLEPWQNYLARQAASYTATPTTTTTSTSASTSNAPPAGTMASTPAVLNQQSKIGLPLAPSKSKTDFAPYVTEPYTNDGYTYSATARDPSGDSVAGLYGTICPNGLADWSRMAFVLQQHGLTGRHIPVTWDGVVAALKRGHPVILGNDLTSVGHIIVAIGYTDNGNLIVNDPYGNRFASGYGGTRGEGLFYPWSCAMSRNAYEVIGDYPPPTGTAALQAPGLMPGLPAGIGAVTSRNDIPWLVSLLKKNAQSTASPAPSATKIALKVIKADMSVRSPGSAAATAVISGWTQEAEQQNILGWGLFSILSLAAAFVGVGSFRKTRRRVVEIAIPTLSNATSGDSSTQATRDAETRSQPGADEVQFKLDEVATPPSIEQEANVTLPVIARLAPRPMLPERAGLRLILRRGLLLAPPLLLIGLKLYQVSKGQQNARTR